MSKKTEAYEFLKNQILTGQLSPDTPIIELEVSTTLKMSRSPIREALCELEMEGFAVNYPGRGFFVSSLSPYDVEEIYELRILLELWALERSIGRITDEELDELKYAFETGFQNKDWEILHKADRALHGTIIQKSFSKQLLDLMKILNAQVDRIRYASAQERIHDERTYKEHLEIIQCIRERNLVKSKSILKSHLHSVALSAIEAAKMREIKNSRFSC